MFKRIALLSMVFVTAVLGGCMTITASRYDANPVNAEHLKAASLLSVNVAPITVEKGSKAKVKSIGMRAANYVAPSGSFCDYIHDALVDELDRADLIDDHASTRIAGLLVENDVDISGVAHASADISVRFTIQRDGRVTFNKVISAHTTWASNFLGAIAINRGVANYPLAVRTLINNLFSDPDFMNALKKT